MSNKAKCSYLELVFPPISNQEAVQLKGEPSVERRLRQSDFYMIGGKPQGLFTEISIDEEEFVIHFNYSIGSIAQDSGEIDIVSLSCLRDLDWSVIGISTGSRYIDIVRTDGNGNPLSVIERFTPEGILWHRSRNSTGISGLNRYKDLSKYDLLYVGIAKVGDSYDRLIAKGHTARMEILANEPQRYPGARVSDETFLFLFRIEPLFISSFGADDDITDDDISLTYDQKRIVADAEKAFVSLLKPQYNSVTFKNYPTGADGLYGSGLDRYSYSIGETLLFNTAHGQISGGRHTMMAGMTNSADFIFVEGDNVTVYVSGKDFPPEDI